MSSYLNRDENGVPVSKTFVDYVTGKSETINFSEEEIERLNPESQFNNIEMPTIEPTEPSFLKDVQRVGLKTVFGPVELASDFLIRPFSEDKEAYDKATDAWLQESKEKVLTTFGEDNISDVLDLKTGKIKGTDTIAGTVVDIGSYIVGGGAVFKILNKINKTRKLGNVTKAVISEQVAEQALSDPDYNLANLANDLTDEDIPVLKYLAADTDDDVLLNRAKQSVVGGLATGVVSGLVKFGFNRLEIEDYSQRIFNKNPEDLTHDTEAKELVGILLQKERAAQKQNPSNVVKNIAENVKETNEGVRQILKQSEKSLTGRTQWIKQRFFTSRGFFSEEAFKAKEAAVSGTRQLVSSGVHHARRLQRFIDDELLATGDETLAKKIMEQLQNKNLKDLSNEDRIKAIVNSGLSEDIAIEIVSARNIIDDLSNYIVDNNVATEGVREAIENNIGTYVTRSYKLFDDPDYVPLNSIKEEAKESIIDGLGEKLSPEQFNNAYDDLADRADKIIDSILDKGETASLNDYITRIRRINKKVFAKRKDISPEIRKLMGEITSPSENISITIQKLASITESHKFYSKLNQLGGSVPRNQALYKQAMEDARTELKDVDFVNLKEQFDIDMPVGTLFRLDDGTTGSLTSVNMANRTVNVRVRDSVSGQIKNEVQTISIDEAREGFIPKTKVVRELANEIYSNKYKGTMTSERYLKPEKSNIFSTQIIGTNSEIDGLFTTPELARAINNLEDTHMFWGAFKQGLKGNELSRYITGAKGLSQQMKTIYDHTTHLRNALGGYQFGLANGINPLTQGKFNQATLWNEIFEGNNRIFDKYYERLQGLGVVNTSVRARETRAMLDIASEARGPDIIASKLEKLAKKYPMSKLARKPEQIYMATDDFFKMNAFAAELSALKKIKPNAPLQQLEEEAAEIVKNTLPNYDRVTQGVKALRELPIGNFVSFPAEIIRTSQHIIRQGYKEVSEGVATGNTALRNRGLQRLGGFTTLNTAWFTTGYLGSKALGLTDQENESYQNLLETPFDRNHNKVIVNIGGEHYAMSSTYINSYNVFQDFALGILQELSEGKIEGKDFTDRLGDATVRALSSVIQPFTDEAMFVETIGDIYTAIKDEQGRTVKGKQIIKDPDDPWSVAWGSLTHAAKGFTPGVVTDFKKYAEALFETPNPYTGQKRSFGATSVEMLTGINFTKFHADDKFIGHARTYNREKNYARTKPSTRYGKESDDYFQEFTEYTAKKFKSAQDFYKQVQSMQNLGYTNIQIAELMERGGLTSTIENALMLRGKFSADNLSVNQKQDMIRTLKNSGEEDPQRLIMDFLTFANGLDLSPKTDDTKKLNQDIFKELSAEQFRKKFKKGGEVNVPDAKKEPDERIDKMTGLPYNIQAGTLGIDEEDPEKRLGLQEGGMYTVQAGDTLSEIAESQNIPQEELQSLNLIEDPNTIQAGQTLKITEPQTNLFPEKTPIMDEVLSIDNEESEMILEAIADRTASNENFKESNLNPYEGGLAKLKTKLKEIDQEVKDGLISSPQERVVRKAGAYADLVLSPIGELVGAVADATGITYATQKAGEAIAATDAYKNTIKYVQDWAKANPNEAEFATQMLKNVDALASVGGPLVALKVLRTAINKGALQTKTIQEGDVKGEKKSFYDSSITNLDKMKMVGVSYLKTFKDAVNEALLPAAMATARVTLPIAKKTEVLNEPSMNKMMGAIATANNLVRQVANRNSIKNLKETNNLLNSSARTAYAYKSLENDLDIKTSFKNAIGKEHTDYDVPDSILDQIAFQIFDKDNEKGGKGIWNLNTKRTGKNFEKLIIDIKRPDGPQALGSEVVGTNPRFGSNLMGKLLKENKAAANRSAMAHFILNTDAKGAVIKKGKTNPLLKKTVNAAKYNEKQINKAIKNATKEQLMAFLKFSGGRKSLKGFNNVFEDPKNPNIIYAIDSYKSNSTESGGVNNIVAIDTKTKDVYSFVSDRHDIFADIDPLSGKSLLTVAPVGKVSLITKEVGKFEGRDYKKESQQALADIKKYNINLDDNKIIIKSSRKVKPLETKIVGVSEKTNITKSNLEDIANAQKIERVGAKFKVTLADGSVKEFTPGEMNGGVAVNITTLANIKAKATATDYGKLASRAGQLYLTGNFVLGDYEKEPRQSRVLGSLIKINKPKRGKLMGALKRVAVNA